MPHLSLPGTAGSFAHAAYRSEYNDATELDVRIDMNYDKLENASFLSRWTITYQRAFAFQTILALPSTSLMFYTYSPAFVTEQFICTASLASAGIYQGERWQLRAHVDLTPSELKFYYRAAGTDLESDTGWTQLGATMTPTAAALYEPITTGLQIGAEYEDGTAQISTGKVYRALLKTSAGTVFDADFEDPATWVYA